MNVFWTEVAVDDISGHASEENEYVQHVVLGECPGVDIRMPDGAGSVEAHCQQYHSKYYGCPDLFAFQPVVVLPVDEDKDNAEKEETPQHAAEIVNGLERHIRSLSVVSSHAEKYESGDQQEGSDGNAVHGFPVECINAVPCHDIDELDAAKDKSEQEGEKYGKVPLGGNPELDVAPAYECGDYSEESADERKEDHQRQKVRDHAQIVADDEYSCGNEKYVSGLESEQYPEQYRECHGKSGHGSISCHHYIFAEPGVASGHLGDGRHVYSAGEHEYDDDEDRERKTQP